MTGKLKIEIVESVETLSKLLKQEKNLQKKERIQALYWIKTNLAETIEHLSALSGKHRTTVSRWLSSYRKGGFSEMVDIYNSLNKLNNSIVSSITCYPFIVDALCVANI